MNVSWNVRDKVYDLTRISELMNDEIGPHESCTVLQAAVSMLKEHFTGNHYHKGKNRSL